MSKLSEKMKKEGKLNTQMSLALLHDEYEHHPRGEKERLKLITRMREEIPCVKQGEGRGAFWYFDINGLHEFGQKLVQERIEEKRETGSTC